MDYSTSRFIGEGGDRMSTVTVRIPEDKRDELKVIASLEKRSIKDVLTELIDEYVERHRETLELLSRPEWIEVIRKGKEEIAKGVKGKALDELAD
jgi:predicted CopG family antitoxin